MQNQNTYQLTSHPIGSKREFWALSWPLMLGLLATTFMMFVDRLFLARYDHLALNASAIGGTAYYMFLVIPMGIMAISEVLVGRLHGEGSHSRIGSATWQMVWLSFLLTPIFWLLAAYTPDLLFAGSGNEIYESFYFQTLMLFAPIQCASIAFCGFFIGIGRVKIVTIAAIIGNIINIALDYVLIFGWDSLPSMGVTGAAFATGVSQLIQTAILAFFFLKENNRKTFGTSDCSLDMNILREGIHIGMPASLGLFFEVIAHFLFFRIIATVGAEQVTLVSMVQSLYILMSFVINAQSKAATTIIANLLGANTRTSIAKVLRSAFTLHSVSFILLFIAVGFFPDLFFQIFSSGDNAKMLGDPYVKQSFHLALLYMSLFFLMDGFVWILVGFLTAAGDTRYIFVVSMITHWLGYLLPTIWLIGYSNGGADVAWAIIAAMSIFNFLFYYWRYHSGSWLTNYRPLPTAAESVYTASAS